MSKVNPGLRWISVADMQKCVQMSQAITLMRSAFSQLSANKAQVPIRTHMKFYEGIAELLSMPVFLTDQQQSGLKLVALSHENPSLELPFIQALMIVMDARRGFPLACMSGGWVTHMRTGAASGLATQLLANKEASVLGIYGTGAQAYTQLDAIMEVRPIKKVLLYNRTPRNTYLFCGKVRKKYNIDFVVLEEPSGFQAADIICTCTRSQTPILKLSDVKPGVHINAVGAYRADMAEIGADLVTASSIYVDQESACRAEAGDLIQAADLHDLNITGELGQVLLDQLPGRASAQQITLFKSVGNAAQDLALASHILQRAQEQELGQLLPL
ncbi:MAG: ornithine cyclodeaminase family protein [Bacteroidota bacterium]